VHKFTRANDFSGLSALLRNFVTAKLDLICGAASLMALPLIEI
jgi:hypothetical protein